MPSHPFGFGADRYPPMHQQTSASRVLYLLKTRGPQTAATLSVEMDMTAMGVRQHLLKLEQAGQVARYNQAEQVGRPRQYWHLTDAAQQAFPDRHADLSLDLIENVREIFGDQGLERLISRREQSTEHSYLAAMAGCSDLAERIHKLAELRSAEGYMARCEFDQEQGCWMLLENHCPICAAAQHCQSFCRAELELFQRVLQAQVERSEHMVLGARRCTYLIREQRRENQLSLL